MAVYEITKGVHELEGQSYCSYGIRCGETSIADLSCNREKVEQLAAMCTRMGLDPLHLRDVAEDFLAEDSAWP